MRFSLYLCFFIIYFCLFKVQCLYILLYIEIPCIILFLQKRYTLGTFAVGRAYMPTQEKKTNLSQEIIEFINDAYQKELHYWKKAALESV